MEQIAMDTNLQLLPMELSETERIQRNVVHLNKRIGPTNGKTNEEQHQTVEKNDCEFEMLCGTIFPKQDLIKQKRNTFDTKKPT